ncbi:hypothetical protein [Aquimarina sp. RZ0]|uniref:hypothetical protein n=1 Tax=Aquimarina sp. RZ0 TaxID=2607730 RepID=UPI0011F2667D|nr:hypothetical protein [Aquimarina sp. RZ0]KAA1243630.1 hypothetical protein F0000_20330 [Aquimarina sp. RZ0]
MNTLYSFRTFILVLSLGIFLTACTKESTEDEKEEINQSLLKDFVEKQLSFTNDISLLLGNQQGFNITRDASPPIHYSYDSLLAELEMANIADAGLVAKTLFVMQNRVNTFLEELKASDDQMTEDAIKSTISDEITRQMVDRRKSLQSKDCNLDLSDSKFNCETNYAITLLENTISNFFDNGPGTFIGIIKTGSLYVSCGSEAMDTFRSCVGD